MPVNRKGLSPVMVGRNAQLRRLTALLPAGRVGEGTPGPEVALVGGEAGIGKSRMVAELLAAVPPTTSQLTGRAGQGAPGRPFSLLLDAVEPVVATWTAVPAALGRRADSIQLLLKPVAPDLGPCDDRQYGPEELLRGAIDLLRYLVPDPAVLIFEDLHVADPESITLFGRLSTVPDLNALLVGTYRPEDLGRRHALARMVADLERRRSITHVSLARLSRSAVGDLLRAVYHCPVSWHVADTVHGRTGGNPFFVEELLLAAGESDPKRLVTLPLPWNLSEVLLRHLDGLEDQERRVIDAAAVLGSRFPFDVLAALVGISEDDLIPLLRQLVDAGLLVENEADVFSFRHALTREAIAGQLLGRERRRLHEKALAVMCELGSDDYTALAHHAQGAGRYEEVVAFARQGAARFVRMGLTHQAVRLAELGLAEEALDVELQTIASQAAWLAGLLDIARSHGEEWRRLAGTAGDRASESAAIRHLARVEWEAGNPDGQRAYAAEALALARADGPSEELALALALMSEVHMLARRPPMDTHQAEEAVRWADQALALADELGCPKVRPRALVNKGSALVDLPGRVAEGIAVLDQALVESRALGDSWNQVRALNNVLSPGSRLWPLSRIQAALDEVRDVAWQTGREGSTMALWVNRSTQLAWFKGDMGEAKEYLAQARSLDPSGIDSVEIGYSLLLEVALAVEEGEVAQAASALAAAQAAVLDEELRVMLGAVAAGLAALRGDAAAAAEHLLSAAGPVVGRCGHNRDDVLIAAITVIRCGVEPPAVQQALERLDHQVPAWPDESLSYHRHVHAALMEMEGKHSEAAEAYREALADPSGYRPVIMVADAEQGVARCLLAEGRTDEARAAAERAVALLERWPGWRSAQAAALLRRTTPPASGHATASGGREPAGAGALTAREREVAALLAEGLSNAQLAQRLYISTKTASVHVSNILAKLAMTSRAEVAAWAVRQGLANVSG